MLSGVSITEDGVLQLRKGANVGLRDLDAELGSVTVVLETRGSHGHPVDADVSVLLLQADGRVGSSDDLIFYNQPVGLGGAVHLRDRIQSDDDAAEPASIDVMTLELDDVPDEVHRVVVAASLDPATGQTFGDASLIVMRLQRSSDARDLVEYRIDDATEETALLFGEIYRRDGAWRVRAVGQGYRGGLAELVVDHGVEVAADSAETNPASSGGDEDGATEAPDDAASSSTTVGASRDDASAPDEVAAAVGEAAEDAAAAVRSVSVRRPSRAPRLPADWDATIPAADGTDWQPARLFPVAGIGGAEEQERRATSAFLAVLTIVREFGRSITALCGAPGGTIDAFVEVPFGHDEDAVRPDGAIRVRRGGREWIALLEVKTGDSPLRAEQVDRYVDVARSRSYDAVITISNELTGASGEHPLGIDRRKLRKVAIFHLSWDQIRAEAITLVRHGGVADQTQLRVLDEFVRYMEHPRSGLHGLTDMGKNWVRVRDGVKARTARSNDKSIAEISGRFDQLVEHVGHELSGLLGVRVQALFARTAPDSATRCQQLADSGLLFGCLRVPGAVNTIIVNADLRADRVASSISVDAPREGRPLTRVNWLLRQLPEHAPETLRIEAMLAGGRGASTVQLLGKLRTDPTALLPPDGRDIRAFTISYELPMGTKRSAASGSLIHSVRAVTTSFYADVVQHLRPWLPKAPRLPE